MRTAENTGLVVLQNAGQGGEEEEAVVCPYKYVPENLRYMCRMDDCCYQNLSDTMLRDHINVIHKDEPYYKLVVCSNQIYIILFDSLSRLRSAINESMLLPRVVKSSQFCYFFKCKNFIC